MKVAKVPNDQTLIIVLVGDLEINNLGTLLQAPLAHPDEFTPYETELASRLSRAMSDELMKK